MKNPFSLVVRTNIGLDPRWYPSAPALSPGGVRPLPAERDAGWLPEDGPGEERGGVKSGHT